jgi:transposase, IS5 family
MSQLSFLSIGLANKKLRCQKFLDEMSRVVPWNRLVGAIKPYYFLNDSNGNGKGSLGGRPAFDLELMLKIHCLQQWFGLSDPAMEDAIYDRNSFQQFLKIDLIGDKVPDETTILNFRHLLEKHSLSKTLFNQINSYLEEHNLLLKEGTAIDATLISAPTSTKNKDKKRDPEMSSTKKGENYYFGMKAHIGVQSRGKPIIHSLEGSTAKDHDSTKTEELLHGNETDIFADKAYDNKEIKQFCRKNNIFYGITNKAKPKQKLSNKQKKRNRLFASVRAKVEHPFQIIKCQWNYRKVRYRGLKKNIAQLHTLCGLANLFMVRKILLNLNLNKA